MIWTTCSLVEEHESQSSNYGRIGTQLSEVTGQPACFLKTPMDLERVWRAIPWIGICTSVAWPDFIHWSDVVVQCFQLWSVLGMGSMGFFQGGGTTWFHMLWLWWGMGTLTGPWRVDLVLGNLFVLCGWSALICALLSEQGFDQTPWWRNRFHLIGRWGASWEITKKLPICIICTIIISLGWAPWNRLGP